MNAPGFNLERVQTPLLLTYNGLWNLAADYELFAGLRMLKKPVDCVVLPESVHQARRPRERQASMQMTVDWMAFWLQGRLSQDPGKSDQNARWTRLQLRRSEGTAPAL